MREKDPCQKQNWEYGDLAVEKGTFVLISVLVAEEAVTWEF